MRIHLNLSNRLGPTVSLWSGQFWCVFWDVWMHLGCWWLSKRWWGRRWWRVWFWLHIVSNVQNTPDDQDISIIGTCNYTVKRKLWSIKCPWQCSADFFLCCLKHIYVVPRLHPAFFFSFCLLLMRLLPLKLSWWRVVPPFLSRFGVRPKRPHRPSRCPKLLFFARKNMTPGKPEQLSLLLIPRPFFPTILKKDFSSR